MDSIERDDLFFLANVMLEQGCPEQSIKYLIKAIEMSPDLTEDQQNLLFAPYRDIAKKFRDALKNFKSVYDAVEVETESQAQAIQVLKQDLSQQLLILCNEICALINEQLLPNAKNPVDKAVYHLVVADFSRFVGELDIPEAEDATYMSHENYTNAKTTAEQCLPIGHPTRLIIDLNYSILLNDVMDQSAQAIELAQNACNVAVAAVPQLPDEKMRALARDILQMLKDNVTQWATESI
ncbi:14-3-3 protein 8 [Tritrichomonas foetus]|uniref:14-3-3 protein 8 n=1 Tax=Tritrichomonas foetus TaxID=1144522 RepID=A0A1J4JMW9_9EUKA|nr:14-3-3 protein 8 [Tritrichomonas foetus]|eukprot:OHT00419.1 14-3-3 protein 8 [Tritrichomonas foetus]